MKSRKTYICFLCGVLMFLFAGCSGRSDGGSSESSTLPEVAEETKGMPDKIAHDYENASTLLQTIEYTVKTYQTTNDVKDYNKLVGDYKDLSFDYDDSDLSPEQKLDCAKLKFSVDSVRKSLDSIIQAGLNKVFTELENKSDYLIEETEEFPIYLKKDEKLRLNIQMESPADVKLYNADSRALLKSYAGRTKVIDSIPIKNSAIYIVEINPRKAQYGNILIQRQVTDVEDLGVVKRVYATTVEAKKGEFRSTSVKGVKMQNLFEEPRKFTLRGQLKTLFSGSCRALVAVQVPTGATDVLYSLRISTNEGDRSCDGEFKDNMELSYKKVKFLGLPLYESHKGSGLISTLLGENQPPREEDAYINMYVFYNSAQAKKFQDGAMASELTYSVDYSTLGTQSCNGRIPAKGYKTIYLAFENERMRYNNYVWLEAVSAVPTTEYFKTEYSVK